MFCEIPSWLKNYCSKDYNHYYDWFNRPFLFEGKDNWAGATDGKMLVALKLPVNNKPAEPAYLIRPDKGSQSFLYQKMFTYIEGPQSKRASTIDILKLKSDLTKLTSKCRKCSNTRFVECVKCNASTEISCSSCEGEGSFLQENTFVRCVHCDGLGVVECNFCQQGKSPCLACSSELNDLQEYEAILALQDQRAGFNLFLLKKLLSNLNDRTKVMLTDKTIYFWDSTQIFILKGLLDDKHITEKIVLDNYLF